MESSDEAVSERSISDMCDEVEVKHVWQDAEDSDSDEEDEDYNPREKQAVKYFCRCYLDWEIPSVKNINHHTTEKKVMNKARTVDIGNTIPKNAESFSSTVLARDPADTIKLLVEMAISNKWVCPALHATGRMQGDDGSMLDILPVVVMVDAFPRTNDISGVMWQLAASFLPEFCNNPNWITRLFGMDGSEGSPECRKYFFKLLSPFLVDCLKNPQNHVFEVVPGYNAARGWPPSMAMMYRSQTLKCIIFEYNHL